MRGSKIKVLWFSNTPANGLEGLGLGGSGSGTWLQTLDRALQDSVDLNVAFYHHKNVEFQLGATRYWGIARYDSLFEKIVSKISERFFDQVLDDRHLRKYLAIIDNVRPDIIHIHGSENPFGAIISRTSIPTVVSIQGLVGAVYEAYSRGLGDKFLGIRSFGFDSLKNLFFPTNFKNTKLKFAKMALIERKNLRDCKYIIGRTEWDNYATTLLAPKRAYFHNDEIMRSEFELAQWRPRSHKAYEVVVHTTADNVYYKGLEAIVDAIIHLKNCGIQCSWRIAGVHPKDLIVRVLKKRAGNNFPLDSLVFMGKVPASQLIDSMLSADCYVLASHIENSPNALCEAMLLGMPCIAAHSGGVGSFIKHQINGLLVQPGDGCSIASSIINISNNKSQAVKYGQLARNMAIQRHNTQKIVNGLVGIYQEIINSQ